jgi:5-methylcytosine-specific restriction endonuclease McrA
MSEANQRLLQAPVLVLNATYEPVNVTAVRRAIVLVLKGVATTEEEDGALVHSTRVALRIPSVIRLTEFRRIPHQTRALSRKNILIRDRYTCQFCGRTLPASDLTLDHVIPRSRGGHTDWDNLVACCHRCNNLKGDRLPEEAGLALKRLPRPFTIHTSRQIMRVLGRSDERWRKYLFY